MSRDDDWRRVSEMAGLDEHEGILPPDASQKLSREPAAWWKTGASRAAKPDTVSENKKAR